MAGKDASLYGKSRPRKLKGSEISASNSLSFTTQLSGLIANTSTQRHRPSAGTASARAKKDDIFSTHNKNAKKRALKDLEGRNEDSGGGLAQKHSTGGGGVDDETWRRAKRRLEDKARLYAAMKRGEVEDADERYAVDFDRKWAEAQERGDGEGGDEEEEEEDEVGDDDEEDVIEYLDEFGRTRRGTRAQAAREERRRRQEHDLAAEPDRFSARPRMPQQVIYGDTIQAAAFNPDRDAAERMEELAQKRDRPATPPPDEHFDSRREIRTKGVGFFQFSGDNEERKRQMDELERERAETERRRAETAGRREERRKEVEARKKAIAEKRGKARADRFLDGLLGEVGDKIGDEGAGEGEAAEPEKS
jgi:Domain of unknown function (DUF4078)